MFFRRKQKPDAPEQRAPYRRELPPDHGIRVILERAHAPFLELGLRSLTFRGAGLEGDRDETGGLLPGECFDATLWHVLEGWDVRTPAVVRRADSRGDRVDVGIEFVNLGNLYGQLNDGLGRHFNRRAVERVAPSAAEPLLASLYSRGHLAPGTVLDLTTAGVGLVVDHAVGVHLEVGARARVSLELPGCRQPLAGGAFIRRVRGLRDRDVVGLEFDAADTAGFPACAAPIRDYCAERESALHLLDETSVLEAA